ncbi:MAG: glycosyltransferase family 4 protein [Terriglobales bacterium]
MRIVLITQYFPPETGAAQNRLWDLAQRLSLFGHQVTVVTSMPNYPQGRIFDGYRRRLFVQEEQEGIRVLRTWAYVTTSRKFISRLLNYLSFAFFAMLTGLIRVGRSDVVVVESPPLFLGVTGVVVSRWHDVPMIVNVSDLWPQSAISMGILHNKILIRLATALETFLYRSSYAITGQTENIVRYVREIIPNVRVELVTNGVDPEKFIGAAEQRYKMRGDFSFGSHFVVGFTGLHGLAYDLEGLLEAAELVGRSDERVLFVFFGDGPRKQLCEELAKQKGLTNVMFFGPQPGDAMPAVLASLDAAIIPLKDLPFFRGTLPSRLFDCMAAKLPIILASVDGEASRLLQTSNGGIWVPAEDVSQMADAARQLASDPDLCHALGENGNRYVCSHYDRREMARRFAELLPSVACSSHAIATSDASQYQTIE